MAPIHVWLKRLIHPYPKPEQLPGISNTSIGRYFGHTAGSSRPQFVGYLPWSQCWRRIGICHQLFRLFKIDPITPTVLVSEDFESSPIALDDDEGFTVVERPNGNNVFVSDSDIRNATSTLVDPVTPTSSPLHVSTLAALSASTDSRFSNGFIVFDYVNSSTYKLAGVEGKNQLWVIAQVSNGDYTRLASVADSTITETGTFELDLMLTSSGATLVTPSGLINVEISGSSFLNNNLGVGAIMANTQFDNFIVSEENGTTSLIRPSGMLDINFRENVSPGGIASRRFFF